MMVANKMQFLRRFARDNLGKSEPVTLAGAEKDALCDAIEHGLRALDGFWEAIAGRQLTEAEKWGGGLEMSALRIGAAVLVDGWGLRGTRLTIADAKEGGYFTLRFAHNGNIVPGLFHRDLIVAE